MPFTYGGAGTSWKDLGPEGLFSVIISVMLVNNDIVLGNRTSGDSEILHLPPPLDISKRPAVSAAVVVGTMHLLATSWATLGALGFVEFELGGEL
jgi:hypothetical protein